MPWKVFKVNNEFCVHKLTSDGKKGEKVACHSAESDAHDQLGALYASESQKNLAEESSLISITKNEETLMSQNNGIPITGHTSIYTYPQQNGVVKGMSLAQIGDLLWSSFKSQFDDYYNMWFHDIYDEDGYVIISWHKKLFKATFTRDDNGATFSEIQDWEEVKRKTEYVPAKDTATNDESPLEEMDDIVKAHGIIKSIDENTFQGYAVIWGNEHKKDLRGEWFDKEKTKELLNVQKTIGAIPWFLEHTTDNVLKSTVIAAIDEMGEDEIGVWYKAKVKQHEIYKKFVQPLIAAKSLMSSSGTFPYAKEVDKETGMLKRWPIAEVSGTVSPMDHHQLEEGKIEEYKKAIGQISQDKSEEITKFLSSTNEEAEGGEEPRQNHDAVLKNYYISKQKLAENSLLALMEKN